MKRILRNALKLLGEKQRHSLYRKMVRLPDEFHSPDFQVEIAQTQEDLERAYALLHDCYVGIKIMDPQPSGLRCNLYSFLPTSTIIVAKYKGQVVGTVSAIKDSSSGLPSDKEFLPENNKFRQQGKVLVEASALAVAPEHRVGHSVSFLLMKYLYNYCRDGFGGDFMIAAVHPKFEDFYKALWHFEKNGEPKRYGSLNDAAAIHISMDLSLEYFKKIIDAFGPEHPTKNLGSMIHTWDPRFQYPRKRQGLSMNPVITPEMLRYFCLEKPGIWKGMSVHDRQTLVQVYSTYFGSDSMSEFRSLETPSLREKEYRTPVKVPSVVSLMGRHPVFCEILDITSQGCYISWSEVWPQEGEMLKIAFRFEGQSYYLQGRVAWCNHHRTLSRGRGFGICFSKSVPELSETLQSLLYGHVVSTATKVREGLA